MGLSDAVLALGPPITRLLLKTGLEVRVEGLLFLLPGLLLLLLLIQVLVLHLFIQLAVVITS